MNSSHVICCNDSVEFVVVGSDDAVRTKLIELRAAHRKSVAHWPEAEYRARCHWHVRTVGFNGPPDGPWRSAVIDALVVSHILQAGHEEDPRKAINDLLAWHQKVALDMAVSQEARDLFEQGRAAGLAEAEAQASEAFDSLPIDRGVDVQESDFGAFVEAGGKVE